jgi:hypothetical protein
MSIKKRTAQSAGTASVALTSSMGETSILPLGRPLSMNACEPTKWHDYNVLIAIAWGVSER